MQGRRSTDYILDPSLPLRLSAESLREVRRIHTIARLVEAELCYQRRMLQGKTDVLAAELKRREVYGTPDAAALLALLPEWGPVAWQSDEAGTTLPYQAEDDRPRRRITDRMIDEPTLDNLTEMGIEELRGTVKRFCHAEEHTAARLRLVRKLLDAARSELDSRANPGVVEEAALLHPK